jgi:hypothetical protein
VESAIDPPAGKRFLRVGKDKDQERRGNALGPHIVIKRVWIRAARYNLTDLTCPNVCMTKSRMQTVPTKFVQQAVAQLLRRAKA